MRTALHDTEVPQVSTIVGAYDKGTYTLIATVTDNLSIKEYWSEARYAAGVGLGGLTIANQLFLPREGGVDVDAYNAASLTTATLATSFSAAAYRAIQSSETAIADLETVAVFARDNADNLSTGALVAGQGGTVAASGLTVADNGFDLNAGQIDAPDQAASVDQVFPDSAYTVFQTLAASTDVDDGVVELTATATGTLFVKPTVTTEFSDGGTPDDTTDDTAQVLSQATEGLRDNPISRVDFYAAVDTDGGNGREALKYIGSVNGATAGAEDFDTEGSAEGIDSRRYIYTLEISEADFLEIVGGDADYGQDDDNDTVDATDGAIVAFAVKDDKGVALSSSAAELTVEK